ncbi:hypothetical protein DITRI_Ditri19aG0065100 [Diplodiscus trichospermus]
MENSGKKINTETKYKTAAVVAAPFLILGGICIGFGCRYVSRAWNSRKTKRSPARSMSIAAIHGGKLALERLVDYQNYRGKTIRTDADIKELETLLGKEQPNFNELQRVLARLEMSRREDEAIKVLEKALEKAQKAGKSHEAYEIEMLLAEVYIYKGDVQKASKCKCLVEERVSDARPPLYNAIISLMSQKEQDALEHWKSFKEIQHITIPPSFHPEEFNEFKNAVNHLKQDIEGATQLRKKR